MASRINVRSVSTNVGWSVLGRSATFGLKFVTVPILARILSPEEFGVVAVAVAVVQFLAMFGGAGLGAALILQPREEARTVHSVFWANLVMALVMAATLFFGAEFFATLLGAPEAAFWLKVMSLLIPIQLSGDVAYALLARRMAFAKDAFWSVLSESAGAAVALVLAVLGFGIWSLVIQQFVAVIIRLFGLMKATGYRPRFVLSFNRLRGLARFSFGIMGSEIANYVTFQSPLVIISRFLGLSDAGAYSVANRFSSIPNQVVLAALMGVLFPAFSQMMDDRKRRADALVLSTQVSTLCLAPMMFGLWAIAEPAMLVIFGPKWVHAWPVLGLLALSKGIMSPCGTFLPYLKGVGQALVLWWSAVLRAILVSSAVAYGAVLGGLTGALIALCFANAVTLVGYSWAVIRTNNMPFVVTFYQFTRPLFTAIAMAICVRFLVDHIRDDVPGAIWQVVIGCAAGAVIYALLALLTERALIRKMIGLAWPQRAAGAGA